MGSLSTTKHCRRCRRFWPPRLRRWPPSSGWYPPFMRTRASTECSSPRPMGNWSHRFHRTRPCWEKITDRHFGKNKQVPRARRMSQRFIRDLPTSEWPQISSVWCALPMARSPVTSAFPSWWKELAAVCRPSNLQISHFARFWIKMASRFSRMISKQIPAPFPRWGKL